MSTLQSPFWSDMSNQIDWKGETVSEKKHRKNDFMQPDEQGRQKTWGERRRHAERRLPVGYETGSDDFDEDFQPATRGMKSESDSLGS